MHLFLDFDGVLHPEPLYGDGQMFCRLPLLENLLRDFPEVLIVVSSTWRDNRTLEQLQAFFSPDIGRRIVGVTPSWRDIPDLVDSIGFQRHAECEAWLRQAGTPWERWIALDDKPWLFKPFLSNLVVCDSAIGIDDQVLQKLRMFFAVKN